MTHATPPRKLGVILYECLTGKRPFEGETVFELVHAIIAHVFDPPRKLRPIDVVGKPAESPPAEVKVLDKFSQRVAEQGADLKRRRQGIERYEAQRSAPRQAAK